jgi:hypothetical protein
MKMKQNSGDTEMYNSTERNHMTLNNKHQGKLMHGTKVSAVNPQTVTYNTCQCSFKSENLAAHTL